MRGLLGGLAAILLLMPGGGGFAADQHAKNAVRAAALDMAAAGRERRDAVMLLVALQTLSEIRDEGGQPALCPPSEREDGSTVQVVSANELLEDARGFARGDTIILEQIDAVARQLPAVGLSLPFYLPSLVRQLDSAALLAERARENGDALGLVAAARMIQAVPASPPTNPESPWSPPSLLADAARLGRDDPAIAHLVGRSFPGSPRGAIQGPIREDLELKPGEFREFRYVFDGSEPADVAVRVKPGPWQGDVEVQVLDDRANSIARGMTHSTQGRSAYVSWLPKACGKFTIQLTNRGHEALHVRLTAGASVGSVCEVRAERVE